MDGKRLEALLAEATVDCYGEEEKFTGVFCTLDEHLTSPLQTRALGDRVEVIEPDEKRSGLRRGIVASVRKGTASTQCPWPSWNSWIQTRSARSG